MKIRERLTGAAATLLIAGLLIGMPWLLLHTTGSPIPIRLPSVDEVAGWLTRPDDGTLALGAIRYAAWLVWLVLAGTLVVEIASATRGLKAPELPGLRLPQLGANRLVAAAAMLFLTLPALAAAAPAWADPATPSTSAPETPLSTTAATQTTTPTTTEAGYVEHVVTRGDTLSGLAKTYLGDADRWPEIFQASTGITQPGGRHLTNPDLIITGWTLRIPAATSSPATSTAGYVDHLVSRGDTLTGLAKTYLGDAARWPEIFAASTGLRQPDGRHLTNPDLIVDGWTLRIPTPAAQAPTTGSIGSGKPTAPPTPVTSPPATAAPTIPPATTSPTTTAAESAAASDQEQATGTGGQVADTSGTGESMSAPWLLTGFTIGGAVLAGSALLVLRRRRQHQFRLRRSGRALAAPRVALAPVEKTITVVGTVSAPTVEFMDRALRNLAIHRTRQGMPMPPLDRVDLTSQALVAHFACPVTLDDPWQASDDAGLRWQITPDAAIDAAEDQPAPYPLLVTCGTTDQGSTCLLNLEQLGTVSLTGDPDYSLDFIRYVGAELAVNPWSRDVTITCLGVADELTAMSPTRFRPAHDTASTAADLHDEAAATVARMSHAGSDLVTARVQQLTGETWGAQVLLVDADTAKDDVIQDLARMIVDQSGATATAIVVTGNRQSIPGTELRLTPNGRIQNRQTGLDLVAVGLTHDEALGCAALLAQAETAEDSPMPATSTAAEGWRSLADDAGALRPEVASATAEQAAVRISAFEERSADEPSPQAPGGTTQPAASISVQVRREVETADPDLDQDVRDWFSADCDRPRLTLLGPVALRAHGTPMAKRKPFFIEVLAYLTLRERGATAEEVAAAFGYNLSTIRNSVKVVRDWLGINPRTGERHLPEASKSRAAELRGIPVYQVDDLLVDIDLFRRLRLRGQARGEHGITDLVTALRLVTGRPFSQLRPGGWSWLSDLNIDHHMVCAIVDVAHHLSAWFLTAGDIRRSRAATETALLAAPYDAMTKLDLAVVTKAEGHIEEARKIVHEVCNEPDEDGLPSEVNDSIGAYIARMDWLEAS
ncbi:MAG: LysM peptidoglycan-binding domain-containing protein [Propionicimonas sp.]